MKHKQLVLGNFDQGLENIIDYITAYFDQFHETLCIAIAGGSCSGKSTLAEKLEAKLNAEKIDVAVLGFDDYYKNRTSSDFPHDSEGRAIFDLPESYCLLEFRDDVRTLLSGQDVNSPIYDKVTNVRCTDSKRLVKASGAVIVEGLFVIEALDNLLGNVLTIFIGADEHVRIGRRIIRDTKVLHDTVEETLAFIYERVEPYYQEHVLPQKDKADLVIINN